ncbi:hypothetical protein N0V93_006880 [Gnomoniopsis smithogilvyi]|uniref:CID domain-containing protein n=1 Tax=Gnomoniopsis smithogilvyi TaxID=1191159 RepID=A0A9W8YP23_9PEZI|nr:hypothetical protein N0V93_006880 [Gnomoniopsis smithogilvyi]
MASHAQLAITKASLLAALLKPAPAADSSLPVLPACSRNEIEQLHGLLSAAAARCSPANVQKCKLWMLQHLIQSSSRTAAFGKYLVAFANSQSGEAKSGTASKPSVKRRRLHLLYVLNDLLFHVKHRTHSQTLFTDIEPHLPALFKAAAAFADAPKHSKKLQDLIQLWQQKGYFADGVHDKLRAIVTEGPNADLEPQAGAATPKGAAAASSLSRDAPYILPSMHGDASTPWYDLPAANWLPVIEPNSTRPMNPSMIKPLQLASGPADKSLTQAVKKLLADVDKIYAQDVRHDGDSAVADISQMGEAIERDEMGEIVRGETYYGWSRAFCEKMKARKNGDGMDVDDRRDSRGSSRSNSRSRSRSRGRGRSSSRGSSRPAMKRRRLSDSPSRTRSRSRSRSRQRGKYSRRRSHSYSSRSRSRSRSPSRRWSRNGHHSRSRSRSYTPPRGLGASNNSNNRPPSGPPHNAFTPPIPQQQQQHYFNQPPPPPPNFPSGTPPNFPGPPSFAPPPQPFNAWNAPPPPPPPPPPSPLPRPLAARTTPSWSSPADRTGLVSAQRRSSGTFARSTSRRVGWRVGMRRLTGHLFHLLLLLHLLASLISRAGIMGTGIEEEAEMGGYRGRGGYGRGRGW